MQTTEISPFLIFTLDKEEYAIEGNKIIEICLLGPLTAIPCTPSHVLGFMNLRGSSLLVMDLATLIGCNEQKMNHFSYVLITYVHESRLGLSIGNNLEMVDIPFEKTTEGTVNYNHKKIKILDLGSLIQT